MEVSGYEFQTGQEATVTVFVDTDEALNAYQIEISCDPAIMDILDVQAGADGFVAAFSNNNGLIEINGFDAQGKGPGQLEFLLLKTKVKAPGNTRISINPVIFADAKGQAIPVSESSLSLSIN